jgi:hypothetical protein
MAPGCGEHFRLQGTFAPGQIDLRHQRSRRSGDTTMHQHSGQCGWSALILFLREERHRREFNLLR